LIRPYHTNIRKELSKMPKIYFYDLWFRNSLLRNFEPILLRWDKWASLENIVFRELLFGFWKENIKFWRTQAQNEVDFIINESKAIEVKFNKNNIKESKYKLFQNQYPNIPLEYLVYDTCIQKIINIYTMSQNPQ
jgi:predicted AAA+ superfamily ATPase